MSCDVPLSVFEMTRRTTPHEFLNLCNFCVAQSDLKEFILIERDDLKHAGDDFFGDDFFREDNFDD